MSSFTAMWAKPDLITLIEGGNNITSFNTLRNLGIAAGIKQILLDL